MLEYFSIGFGAEAGVRILDKIQQEGKYRKKDPSKKILKNLLGLAQNCKMVLSEEKYDHKLSSYYSMFLHEDWNKKNVLNNFVDETINTLEEMIENKRVSRKGVKNSEIFFKDISDKCLSLQNYESPYLY